MFGHPPADLSSASHLCDSWPVLMKHVDKCLEVLAALALLWPDPGMAKVLSIVVVWLNFMNYRALVHMSMKVCWSAWSALGCFLPGAICIAGSPVRWLILLTVACRLVRMVTEEQEVVRPNEGRHQELAAEAARMTQEKSDERDLAVARVTQEKDQERVAEVARMKQEKNDEREAVVARVTQERVAEVARVKQEKNDERDAAVAVVTQEKDQERVAEVARVKQEMSQLTREEDEESGRRLDLWLRSNCLSKVEDSLGDDDFPLPFVIFDKKFEQERLIKILMQDVNEDDVVCNVIPHGCEVQIHTYTKSFNFALPNFAFEFQHDQCHMVDGILTIVFKMHPVVKQVVRPARRQHDLEVASHLPQTGSNADWYRIGTADSAAGSPTEPSMIGIAMLEGAAGH